MLNALMLSTFKIHHLLGDPLRLQLLEILISGEGRTAGELANILQVSPSQLSHHLKMLTSFGMLKCEAMGRHRYYMIASNEIAKSLEDMLTATQSLPIHSYKIDSKLKYARSCYHHLAGRLGVTIFEYCLQQSYIHWKEQQLLLTQKGADFFKKLFNEQSLAFTYSLKYCVDFSERRYHLSGALGQHLLKHFLNEKWLVRDGHSRVLQVTHLGKKLFKSYFNS